MSDSTNKSGSGWKADIVFLGFVFLCILFFAGEPDLHDVIIQWLMSHAK